MTTNTRGTVFLRPEARARHLEPLVELEHARVEYPADEGVPTVAIADLSIAVARGELVAVVGPQRSGRSTLLHLMAGLERPTSGRVAFDGTDLGTLPDARLDALRCRAIGIVHSESFLLDGLSVLENVMLPMRLAGAGRRAARERARELLERHDLAAIAASAPAALTLEQQQYIAVVRALANDPLLLLADEPGRHLDPDGAGRLHDFLGSLHRNGLTIVYATGDQALALRARRRLHLADGRIDSEEEAFE
ncbi:MAG TPA: ATP-binding cassette domain-containing protein [Candidatus Kapabacteria bacterium]|nr:ATP-binding cassette domain-containing protein [Candidatus Kapabacteria bacterium]